MTGPTREEVLEWAKQTGLTHATPERLERFAALAFAAGTRSGEDARDAALDLLETMYRLWENGTDCYEDPEDCTGYLGKAVDLDDPTEHKIIDLLNEHRPTKSPFDAAMGAPDAS